VLIEAVLLAALATHPAAREVFQDDIESTAFLGEGHEALRQALLAAPAVLPPGAAAILERLLADPHVRVAPPVRPAADPDLVRLCLAEGFAKLAARRGARAEIDEASADLGGQADEGVTWRLAQAARAAQAAVRPAATDAGDLGEDRAALSRQLQALLGSRVWEKKKKG